MEIKIQERALEVSTACYIEHTGCFVLNKQPVICMFTDYDVPIQEHKERFMMSWNSGQLFSDVHPDNM